MKVSQLGLHATMLTYLHMGVNAPPSPEYNSRTLIGD